jgi:hypothetical protein
MDESVSSIKCASCGLVNWMQAETCKRCGAVLSGWAAPLLHGAAVDLQETPPPPGILRRAAIIIGIVSLFCVSAYLSLIITSDPLTAAQRQTVDQAISVLEQRGFTQDAFVLRHLVSLRSTDNWWNRRIGHMEAYAATNCPFGVITLYQDFFNAPVDDTERAAILLHESFHLVGRGEPAAYASVWRARRRLGWTSEQYGGTSVWKSVRELTMTYAPELFQCGANGQDDCTE